MKKFAMGGMAGILLGLALAVIAGEVFYQGKEIVVIADSENIREAPGGKVLASANKGTPMVVLADSEKWLKIVMTGYIWKESVSGEKAKLLGKSYRASMIVAKTEADANAILAEVRSGTDFATLAKQKSIDSATAARGGDLGEFFKGDFSPEIETAITRLNPGEFSTVVKTTSGYCIFKRTQ